MTENSAIEWTTHTWRGCTRVSPGCAHCYMFKEQLRYKLPPGPDIVVRTSKSIWNKPKRWQRQAEETGDQIQVFTCSWSDWFHVDADAWREEAWEVIRMTPNLNYQVLTKRSERIEECLPEDWGEGYPNVWLGVSVENNRWRSRISDLLDVPAKVRFISAEPLLGPLDLSFPPEKYLAPVLEDGIDWVIVGGESGPKCRPMDLDWARKLRDECQRTGTAYFLKQLGGHPNKRGEEEAILDGRRWTEMPA